MIIIEGFIGIVLITGTFINLYISEKQIKK
jgi:uncharacterized protein YneF (UPF0154 family)